MTRSEVVQRALAATEEAERQLGTGHGAIEMSTAWATIGIAWATIAQNMPGPVALPAAD